MTKQKKISYVKKPFARRSFMSLGLMAAGFFLFLGSMALGIMGAGNAGLNAGASGFCSLVVCTVGFWYGLLAFLEKEKNYTLARISVVLSGVLIIFWVCLMIAGMRA